MAAFINNDITSAGLLVLAKAQTGAPIRYTRIVLGDGFLPQGSIPRNLTAVINPVVSLEITKCKLNGDGTVVVGTTFTNTELETEFYYRELGLYAEDVDLGEVLYCYGNAGELAERIVPGGEAAIVEKMVDIITAIGTATHVTANIASDVYATKEELDKLSNDAGNAIEELQKQWDTMFAGNTAMLQEIYDPDGEVAAAGGIAGYMDMRRMRLGTQSVEWTTPNFP